MVNSHHIARGAARIRSSAVTLMTKRNQSSGFTLVELIVAMGLMSLISLTLVGAYRGIAQVSDRFDRWQNALDDQRLFVSALTELLALGYVPTGTAGQGRVFVAGADQLVWVGVMPPRHARGGKYIFRLAVESSELEPSKLVLRYTPWLGRAPDWVGSDHHTVLAGVQSLRFTYFSEGKSWPATEADLPAGPDRVRLSVQMASGVAMPQLMVPFKSMKRTSDASFGAGASP